MDWFVFIKILSLTVFIYLFFPLCYEFLYGRVSNKKAKKLALCNSLICCTIFCIIKEWLEADWGIFLSINFSAPVFWFFIVKFILVDKKIPDEEKKPKQKKENKIKSIFANIKCKTSNKSTNNTTNELKELKSLLDEGIITQEEFDQKKKQILDL